MGGETLPLCVDVIVKDPVVVKEPVFVTDRVWVGVLVPEVLRVNEEVDELVAEGLGSTEGVMDCVWKEVTVELVVREGDPVPVFDFVRLAEAVREGVTVRSPVKVVVLLGLRVADAVRVGEIVTVGVFVAN
jgi:hypothetical protein